MRKHILFLGFGYCAAHLWEGLDTREWSGYATYRDAQKKDALRAKNITPILFPDEVPQSITHSLTHCLISAPPQDGKDIFAPLMPSRQLDWCGYLSTTGVYGDSGGAWVDESAPLNPASERGVARVAAEQAWAEWAAGSETPLAIFRLAGIYGAGRNAYARLAAGTARRIYKKEQVFSRIHVEDVAAILAASIAAQKGGIYNCGDDAPAPPQDVIAYAAAKLNMPAPPLINIEDAALSPMAQSFYGENKRVDNKRIKNDLGVKLRYPNYESGLDSLYNEIKNEK